MITLTLSCAPKACPRLLRHPCLNPGGRRPRPRKTAQTWHDTPDLLLAQRDRALMETAGRWYLDRMGLGWPRLPATLPSRFAEAINPAGLEEALGEPLPGPLHAIGRFEGSLTRLVPAIGDEALTFHLLRGELRALEPGGPASAPKALAHIEIVGPAAAALDLARLLAADLPIMPALRSLGQELLALRGTKAKVPPPVLSAEMPTEEALAITASGFITTFLSRLGQIPDRDGPEAVHQARVTMRRIRALLLGFRPILHDAELRLKPMLAELKAVLGPARDWDVFLSETVNVIAEDRPADDPALAWLRDAAHAQRERAYATLIAYQSEPAYRDLVWRLVGLCHGAEWRHLLRPEPVPEPLTAIAAAEAAAGELALAERPKALSYDPNHLGEFARHCVEKRWKRTARPVKELMAMSLPELHAMRIKCKKLRYQVEIFQDALPAKTARRMIEQLTATQEIMGKLNDGVVADELVASLRPPPNAPLRDQVLGAEAIGLIHGYGLNRTKGGREAVYEAWHTLLKSGPA
jgi:CHAD domain-containing protein